MAAKTAVIDCSFALPLFVAEDASSWAKRAFKEIGDAEIWVPALWLPEIVNALLVNERRKRLSAADREDALAAIELMPFHIDNLNCAPGALSQLALHHALTPYDAIYFELAQRRKLTLFTLDKALIKAAHSASLPFITMNPP